MPKLTCHCGCVEAEINVPIKELAKVVIRVSKRIKKESKREHLCVILMHCG